MTLRPYQNECIEAVISNYSDGKLRQIVSLPTGSGKTVVFSELIRQLNLRRVLVVAHRKELLDQAYRKIIAVNGDKRIGIEQSDRVASFDDDVVIGCVPTLRGKRLEKWPRDHFDAVIIDEAHHASADSYMNLVDHFYAGTHRLLLGVTATAFRGSGEQDLGEVFDHLTYHRSIKELIKAGYLSNIHCNLIGTDINLDNVGNVGDDFNQKQLAAAINIDNRNRTIIQAYQKYCDGLKTVVFCVNVDHAMTICDMLNEQTEHLAAPIWGAMDKELRKDTLERFDKGEIRTLTNVMVLTEGWDCPDIGAIIMGCPTQSKVKYIQCVGRGTRIAKGKPYLTLVDITDTSMNRDICYAGIILDKRMPIDDADLLEWEIEQEEIELQKQREREDAKVARQKSRLIDIMNTQFESDYAWVKLSEGHLFLQIKDDTYHIFGEFAVQNHAIVFRSTNSDELGMTMDGIISRNPSARLVERDAPWRQVPASDAQLALLTRLNVEFPPQISKGEAGDLITKTFNCPATSKQLYFLRQNNIEHGEWLTKAEASRLIEGLK